MPAGFDRKPQFRAHAIGARDQYRPPVAIHRDLHQRAKATDSCQDFGPLGALDQWLDALDQLIARINVDAGIAIGVAADFAHIYLTVAGRRVACAGPPHAGVPKARYSS